MAEIEFDMSDGVERARLFHFEWVLPVLVRPRRALTQIVQKSSAVWLVPLVLLTIFALIMVAAGGPIRQTEAQAQITFPPDFEFYPPEWQQQYQEGIAARQGFVFIYVYPALGVLASIWIGWFLVSSLLHLGLTLAGSRNNNTAVLNLVAWASLPFALRYLIQAVYLVSTNTAIRAPGLSGFIPSDAAGFLLFLRSFLSLVDIYLIWYLALLIGGVVIIAGVSRAKAIIVTAVLSLLFLAIQALPGFLLALFGGVQTQRPFFFF
ncbi:MAG: YIP1 family protein [Anaerolineaceae bacterium]